MAEDTEYKKLPCEERCDHKLWKARVDGYEEAAKIFRSLDDEKSPEWTRYLGLIKKMVVDPNAPAQERGMEAALIFVENSGFAGKTASDVMSGIVLKCIAAPKTKTKDLAVQITLKYIEIEKHEAVVEELIKGMEQKNPKVVAACVAATTLALHEFGNKVIGVKPLIKKLAPLMSDRDKAVRDEGKLLAVEIYRWIGAAMKPQISTLPQVTIKELEEEFDKLRGEKPTPTRYLKSAQEKIAKSAIRKAEIEDEAEDGDEEVKEEIDPLDLLDPVDILSKLPKDFFDKLDEKKWQLRKESLDALEKLLTDNQKLESGDYGGVVQALRKIITKDSNVVLVALAGKCMAMLAKGLGKRFSPYAMGCLPSLLEKFKEKKPNVVTALREATDAIYPATSLEQMQECIVEALNNKNPNVKSETTSFLARAIAHTQPTAINKKLLKLLVTSLIKTLNEPDPTVRDCSAEAIATLLKLMGDKAVSPFLTDVDALKMAKIKEFLEKVELKVKIASAKSARPASAPTKAAVSVSRPANSETKAAAGSRPATAGPKKVIGGGLKKPAAGAAGKSGVAKPLATERELLPDEVEEKAEELLSADIYAGLIDTAWKTRVTAAENLLEEARNFDAKTPNLTQILIRSLAGRKPGLRETNFQVLKLKLDIIRVLSENYPLTITTIDAVINEVADKLSDAKNGAAAADVLTAFAESTKLEYVSNKVLNFAFDQKSPKLQLEALQWLNKSILEFGYQMQPKNMMPNVRKALTSTNPAVRGAAITLVGTISLYLGRSVLTHFEGEKPALKAQIETELDNCEGSKPPKATRGLMKGAGSTTSASSACDADNAGNHVDVEQNAPYDYEEEDGNEPEAPALATDVAPRVDISAQINEALLREMSDKDWKMRNEGLTKLQAIIAEAKQIKPCIGDLAQALAARLVDSNAKIAQTALAICEQLANATGPGCKNYVRYLFPGFLHALGDSKSFVRSAALNCINTFGEQGGYKEFFESEMIADALKSGSPALKTELWAWLAERLLQIPTRTITKDELTTLLPALYAHISDRNAEVRKNANEAVLGIMIHLGYDNMVRALDKQKPSAKKDIQAALDKARPNLPVKPLPKGKQQAPIEDVKKTVRGGGGAASGGGGGGAAVNKKHISAGNKSDAAAGASRKKEEDTDTSPLLAVNNNKNQRLIDEQKMRVIKWMFTQPREEFIDLLREQMTAANVNKALMANMFHDDFRYHLKVIESLSDDLPNNGRALVCNLDLILKWLSLRFYDTNPSVLIKGLEYLNQVFQALVGMEYILAENEGSSFIPHLLLKLGDPKDSVRNGVRGLIRQILLVYPYAKVFTHVMDGLKSKNARQRTECLDELGYLIESYGLTVCQPSQQVALKEIAKHISDRDNSVRNAALNSVVQAYFLAGEKIYKLIGNLNEKDLSMLDERIKRAKKTKKPTAAALPVSLAAPTENHNRRTMNLGSAPSGIVHQESIEIEDVGDELQHDEPGPSTFDQPANQQQYMSQLQQQLQQQQQQLLQTLKPKGPFGLDPDIIADIERDWVRVDSMVQRDVQKVDISLLYEPVKVLPTRDGVKYPEDKFEELLSRSRYMQQVHTTPPPPTNATNLNGSPYTTSPRSTNNYSTNVQNHSPSLADVLIKQDPNLIKKIRGISSTDSLTARAAINELAEIVESPEKQAVLRDYEEIFINSVLAQIKHLSQIPIDDALLVYHPMLSMLYSFFYSKNLGRTLGIGTLKNLMSSLLHLMADQKLNTGEEGQFNKVINGICLKALDKANFTNINIALIRLLRETCPVANLPKFTDLLMKCIWRNVKMLPERTNELNYDAVILEIHEFMLELPSTWWQKRPSDTPLRTVKTVIHNMAKVKGNAILQHLNQIPTHSELHAYLIKILKSLQKDGILPPSSPAARSSSSKDILAKRLANQMHEPLSHIFGLISDKDTKQEGLEKLYKFKVQHPSIDVATFLKGASPNFQKYIEDGLADIERSKQACNADNGDNKSVISTGSNESYDTASTGEPCIGKSGGDQKDPDYWLGRLKFLRAKGNLAPHNLDDNLITTQQMMVDNKVANENMSLSATLKTDRTTLRLQHHDTQEMAPNRLKDIQDKLAQLKKHNH